LAASLAGSAAFFSSGALAASPPSLASSAPSLALPSSFLSPSFTSAGYYS